MTPREQAACSAAAAVLADGLQPGDEVSGFWPTAVIEEMRYALRRSGLRIELRGYPGTDERGLYWICVGGR